MTETDIQPIPMSDYNKWAGAYGLHLPADPNVLYLSRPDDLLWWQRLPDGALYVQYNEMQIAALPDLESALANPDVSMALLDLRNNFGGEVFTVDRMKNAVADWLAADPGHHLDVATARNTFSAASLLVARLSAMDRVTVVGEPMGGCPTGWGNNRDFPLDYSGIPISVATTFEVGASADDTRSTIQPDRLQELTHRDWFEKLDPVVESHVPGVA